MRYITLLIFLFSSLFLSGKTYYLSPSGSDATLGHWQLRAIHLTAASMTLKEYFINVGEANTSLNINFAATADSHIACPVFERISNVNNV